jgi:TrmH family RNA methyltransferase
MDITASRMPPNVAVVLISPRNPLNIGAAARAMSNFGFLDMRLVDAYEVAYQEARSAVNASAVLKASTQHATLAEAIADCSLVVGTASKGHRELQHTFRRLEAGGQLIASHPGKTALLFGSEKFGLSNDDISHCHSLMRIPTRDEHESMNLGQAVAVCLYELVRSPTAEAPTTQEIEPARAEDLERITQSFLQILDQSGYTNPKTAASTELKLRRMIHRLDLGGRDPEMLLGMLRQIRWRLEQDRKEG